MKVGATIGQILAPANQRSVAAGSTSFAELLASGRSVSSIRSQRAFGFSETGLLGALRPVESAGTARAQQAIEAPQDFVRQPTDSGRIVDRSEAISRFNRPAILAGQSKVVPAEVVRFSGNVETQTPSMIQVGQSRNVGKPANYLGIPISGTPTSPAERKQMAEKRKRLLTLSGPDDGLIISIREFDDDENQDVGLFFAFFAISSQFGMTLSAIRFNKSKFDLNFESRRV